MVYHIPLYTYYAKKAYILFKHSKYIFILRLAERPNAVILWGVFKPRTDDDIFNKTATTRLFCTLSYDHNEII